MATLVEIVFVMQFITFLSLFFWKLGNVMHLGVKYTRTTIFMTLVGGMITYGIGIVSGIVGYNSLLIPLLLMLETWVFGVFVMLFLAELILQFRVFAGPKKAYNTNAMGKYGGDK